MADQDIDERALIAQAKNDREAFGALYDLYVQRIYSYIYYRTGNHHDAEDLTARVFFRAMQHIGRYQDHGAPFSAWLYRIARNLLANWYRDEGKRQMIALDHVAHQFASEDLELTSELGEDRETLLTAIRRLPAERQELLILKHLERLPNAEIGQIMGRSEGAIKSLYYRTLVALQHELADQDDGTQRRPTGAGRLPEE